MIRLEELSDAQLVLVAARGRGEALSEIYQRHAGAVFGLARRVLSDNAEAEDVTQEVFLALWNQPERFDPHRGTLRTFLLTNAHSRAVDLVRARVRRAEREHREAAERTRSLAALDRELEDLVLADHVAQALASIPADERLAIEVAYFDGLTYREVAAVLQTPEGTIKARIRSGLRRMRSLLSEGSLEGSREDR